MVNMFDGTEIAGDIIGAAAASYLYFHKMKKAPMVVFIVGDLVYIYALRASALTQAKTSLSTGDVPYIPIAGSSSSKSSVVEINALNNKQMLVDSISKFLTCFVLQGAEQMLIKENLGLMRAFMDQLILNVGGQIVGHAARYIQNANTADQFPAST